MEIDTRQALMAFLLTMTHIVTHKQQQLLTPTLPPPLPAALCDTRHSCQTQFKKLINMPNSLIPIKMLRKRAGCSAVEHDSHFVWPLAHTHTHRNTITHTHTHSLFQWEPHNCIPWRGRFTYSARMVISWPVLTGVSSSLSSIVCNPHENWNCIRPFCRNSAM